MEITATGRHIEITPAIKDYATNKTNKLPRYFDRIQAIEVISDRHDNHGYQVEVIVKAEHTDPFIARSAGDDLYRCVDVVVDKLERQLTDHKQRLRNRKHQT